MGMDWRGDTRSGRHAAIVCLLTGAEAGNPAAGNAANSPLPPETGRGWGETGKQQDNGRCSLGYAGSIVAHMGRQQAWLASSNFFIERDFGSICCLLG